MINPPKTLKEAKLYRYSEWAGNPDGIPFDELKCAYEVYGKHLPRQCARNAGHGPDRLYCTQHAKIIK